MTLALLKARARSHGNWNARPENTSNQKKSIAYVYNYSFHISQGLVSITLFRF